MQPARAARSWAALQTQILSQENLAGVEHPAPASIGWLLDAIAALPLLGVVKNHPKLLISSLLAETSPTRMSQVFSNQHGHSPLFLSYAALLHPLPELVRGSHL